MPNAPRSSPTPLRRRRRPCAAVAFVPAAHVRRTSQLPSPSPLPPIFYEPTMRNILYQVASPQQLAVILWDEMRLTPPGVAKRGAPARSTDESTLQVTVDRDAARPYTNTAVWASCVRSSNGVLSLCVSPYLTIIAFIYVAGAGTGAARAAGQWQRRTSGRRDWRWHSARVWRPTAPRRDGAGVSHSGQAQRYA
ncbi:hypothetical protein T492DRAFT_1087429 [Pavlovales sp. CCMP2436]|nr:hypothetical protein T492DRAFT_1087429 [Pavlovales sp. CCMP2436]